MKKVLLLLLLVLTFILVGCKEEKVNITLIMESSNIVPTFQITKGKRVETKDVVGALHNQYYGGYGFYNYILFNDEDMMESYNGEKVYEDKTFYFRRLDPRYSEKKIIQLYEQVDYYFNIDLDFETFKEYFTNAINDSTYITSIDSSSYIRVKEGIETATLRFYTSKDETIEIKMPLIDTAILIFDMYSGGCELYEEKVLAEKGKDLLISENLGYLDGHSWIDMDNLEVYENVITNVSKSTTLYHYGKYGPWFGYTNAYISRHNDFEFSMGKIISHDTLVEYSNIVLDDGTIVIEKDGLTYSFAKSFQFEEYYYVKCIKSNNHLFGKSLEDDNNKLSILFNSDNGVYNNNQIEVIIDESGYIINSKENPIYG